MSSSKNRKSKRQIRLEKNKNIFSDYFWNYKVTVIPKQQELLNKALEEKYGKIKIKNEK